MNCTYCPAHSTSKPIVTVGSGSCDLLIVINEPAYSDLAAGVPMTGRQYQYIWDILTQMGVSFYVTSVLKCKTNKHGADEYCIHNFQEEVATLQPKCILFSGDNALVNGLNGIVETAPVLADYRMYAHEHIIKGYKTKVLATYNLAFIDETKEMLYNRVVDDIIYAGRHAVSYKYDGVYKSVTLNKGQFHRVVDILLANSSVEYVAFDTESNGLDPLLDNSLITSFSFCYDGKVGYNVFLYHPSLDIQDDDRTQIVEDAKRLLTSKKIIAHHAKHEYRYTKVVWGFTPNIVEDTMYMSYILYLSYPGISHGLKHLSGRFLSMPPWEEIIDRYTSLFKSMKRWKELSPERVSEVQSLFSDQKLTESEIDQMYQIVHDPTYYIKPEYSDEHQDPMYWLVPDHVMEGYAGLDAIAPYRLMQVFKPQIEADPGLLSAYNMMVEGAEAFANIELHGVRLMDLDKWNEIYDRHISEALLKIRDVKEVRDYEYETGSQFNPSSSKQLQDIMFQRMKFPVKEMTNKGLPSTSETVLIELIKEFRDKEDAESQRMCDFLLILREYKKLAKIKSAYFEGLKGYVHKNKSYDGITCSMYNVPLYKGEEMDMIHPGYMLHGTDTGRISSQSPSMHTIPYRSDVKRAIAPIYRNHGGLYIMSDQSQLEIRVLAAIVDKYYGDPTLADAYRQGRDIHRYNASKVFNKPEDEIVDAERRFAKTISFSLLYGSSEQSVAENTGRTPEEVHNLFESFYNSFPGVRSYIKAAHEYARTYGCVRTPMGRIKHVRNALNPDDRGNFNRALRQAQNGIIQSTGSDLSFNSIVYANRYIREHNMKSRIVAFVHDSLTMDAYPTEWFEAYDLLLYSMKTLNEQLDFITCPLGIDVDLTTNMGDHATVKSMEIQDDQSRVFTLHGYDYVIDSIVEESRVGYEILSDELVSSEEVVEETGDLIARKTINLSYDNQKFTDQVRKLHLRRKS